MVGWTDPSIVAMHLRGAVDQIGGESNRFAESPTTAGNAESGATSMYGPLSSVGLIVDSGFHDNLNSPSATSSRISFGNNGIT